MKLIKTDAFWEDDAGFNAPSITVVKLIQFFCVDWTHVSLLSSLSPNYRMI